MYKISHSTRRNANRAVSSVIGALLIFTIAIISFSLFQATEVPAQNSAIEAEHYNDIQGDLSGVQAALIDAESTGERRSATVDLGPEYPTRTLAVNPAPPAGRLETTVAGSGELKFSTGPTKLNSICNLQGQPNNGNVATKALAYMPGYYYFDGGNVQHRLEETLLYQASGAQGGAVARAGPSLATPASRTVRLTPLQGSLQTTGTERSSVTFVGGYADSTKLTDASITLPTTAGANFWQEQYADVNDVSVADINGDAVEITFTGQWEFQCAPVAISDAPSQLPTAEAGDDESIVEDTEIELDGTDSKPESTIDSYSWSLENGNPPATLQDADTAMPTFVADTDVNGNVQVDVELTVTDVDGNTDTDTMTVTIKDTDGGGNDGGNGGSCPDGTSPPCN